MFMFQTLRRLGLTDSEIKVYKTLSEGGGSSVSNLAERTGIHRTNLYDILERLREKDLVSTIKIDNNKYYSITEPKNLMALVEKQKKELASIKTEIADIIKNIKPIKKFEGENRIEIFQDKGGLQFFYERLIDIAKSKDEVLVIGSSQTVQNVFNYYMLNLTKKIKEINIRGRMIANKRIIRSSIMKRIVAMVNLDLRFLPSGYVSPVAVFVFKDNVGFCNFMENPFVILIEDQNIASAYKRHFEELWEKAGK